MHTVPADAAMLTCRLHPCHTIPGAGETLDLVGIDCHDLNLSIAVLPQ